MATAHKGYPLSVVGEPSTLQFTEERLGAISRTVTREAPGVSRQWRGRRFV